MPASQRHPGKARAPGGGYAAPVQDDVTFQLADVLARWACPCSFNRQSRPIGIVRTNDLFISKVVHKAYVDVNEEGPSGGGHGVVGVRMAARPAPTPTFRADHPFVFGSVTTKPAASCSWDGWRSEE